jgi:hypothetical protein
LLAWLLAALACTTGLAQVRLGLLALLLLLHWALELLLPLLGLALLVVLLLVLGLLRLLALLLPLVALQTHFLAQQLIKRLCQV